MQKSCSHFCSCRDPQDSISDECTQALVASPILEQVYARVRKAHSRTGSAIAPTLRRNCSHSRSRCPILQCLPCGRDEQLVTNFKWPASGTHVGQFTAQENLERIRLTKCKPVRSGKKQQAYDDIDTLQAALFSRASGPLLLEARRRD